MDIMGFYDTVLHIDSADPAIFKMVVRNAINYLNAIPAEKFELHIVANGGGATLVTKGHDELHALAKEIVARGVVIKVCANALAENNIEHENVWPECVIVPAGLVEVARLQKAGFSYIKP